MLRTKTEDRNINDELNALEERLSTIEALQAMVQEEVILNDISEACGRSERRVQILQLTSEPISRSDLLKISGVSPAHLSRAMKPLREHRIVHQYQENGEVYYKWAPLLQHLDKNKILEASRRQLRPKDESLYEIYQKALFDEGLIHEIKPPVKDLTPYKNRTLIESKGKPLSEILIEERR